MLHYIKNSIDAGDLHRYFNNVTKHLLYIKTLYISPIHRADLQGYVISLGPNMGMQAIFKFGWGREVVRMQQGFHFFLSGTKKLPFS